VKILNSPAAVMTEFFRSLKKQPLGFMTPGRFGKAWMSESKDLPAGRADMFGPRRLQSLTGYGAFV